VGERSRPIGKESSRSRVIRGKTGIGASKGLVSVGGGPTRVHRFWSGEENRRRGFVRCDGRRILLRSRWGGGGVTMEHEKPTLNRGLKKKNNGVTRKTGDRSALYQWMVKRKLRRDDLGGEF